jgi:hypothetical protein
MKRPTIEELEAALAFFEFCIDILDDHYFCDSNRTSEQDFIAGSKHKNTIRAALSQAIDEAKLRELK